MKSAPELYQRFLQSTGKQQDVEQEPDEVAVDGNASE